MDVVVVSNKKQVFTLQSLGGFKVKVFRGGSGLGFVRDYAVRSCGDGLVVMFDDDLKISQSFWSWISNLKRGEFAVAKVGEHFSTRAFAIHKADYVKVGGFDKSVKYVFEDGDFVIRALNAGLKLKIVPNSLFCHVEHPRFRYRNLAAFNWEYCRFFVKYKRWVYRNLLEFFWRPFDWRIKLPDLATKVPFTVFWIIRSAF